jgi:hypothetical protein
MCVAVGISGPHAPAAPTLVEQWNGSSWASVPSPNPAAADYSDLHGVHCLTVTNCWAVGDWSNSADTFHVLIEKWNGTAWTIVAA